MGTADEFLLSSSDYSAAACSIIMCVTTLSYLRRSAVWQSQGRPKLVTNWILLIGTRNWQLYVVHAGGNLRRCSHT